MNREDMTRVGRRLVDVVERVDLEVRLASQWVINAREGRVEFGPFLLLTRSYMADQARNYFEMGADAYEGGWRPPTPPVVPRRHLSAI